MIASSKGSVLIEGSVAEVLADLCMATVRVRDSLIDSMGKDFGEANAMIAEVCVDAMKLDYVSNDKEGEN